MRAALPTRERTRPASKRRAQLGFSAGIDAKKCATPFNPPNLCLPRGDKPSKFARSRVSRGGPGAVPRQGRSRGDGMDSFTEAYQKSVKLLKTKCFDPRWSDLEARIKIL